VRLAPRLFSRRASCALWSGVAVEDSLGSGTVRDCGISNSLASVSVHLVVLLAVGTALELPFPRSGCVTSACVRCFDFSRRPVSSSVWLLSDSVSSLSTSASCGIYTVFDALFGPLSALQFLRYPVAEGIGLSIAHARTLAASWLLGYLPAYFCGVV
jgi:hypothetical protein